jgi:homogentisate solanesyltransferase
VASIYVVNQIVDIESDRINHKLFLLPHGFLGIRTAWVLAALCATGGIGTALLWFDGVMAVLFLFGLVLGLLYNLPPARLKNGAIGGVVANFLGHGVCTYLVGWYAARWIPGQGIPTVDEWLVPSLGPGFANAAVFLATTIPDAEGDRATGKRTFCVAYGEKATAVTAALFCLFALVSTLAMQYNRWVMAVPTAMSLALFIYHAIVTRKEMAFQTFKWPVFLLSAFVSVHVPTYGILILCTFFGSRAYYRWRFGIDYPTFKSQ